LLAILATVGILKRVAFEFARGVRRGLNGYERAIGNRKREVEPANGHNLEKSAWIISGLMRNAGVPVYSMWRILRCELQ